MASKHLIRWKFCFFTIAGITATVLMWLISQQPHTLVQKMNWMYFYEYDPIYKNNFTFTLHEHVKCKDRNPFLVILVTSRPKDALARHTIRLTWGSVNMWLGHHVKTLFLLGQAPTGDTKTETLIEEESKLNGDIIQQNFLDTYRNLTLKTIMAFQWVSEFCSNATYIMKADSDVFINTPNLLNFLQKFNSSDSLFTGHTFIENYSERNIFLKNYISYEEYPFRLFPPYCSGLGYVLSGKLALEIYKIMSHIKPIWIEDAYVGMCLKVLNVNVHIPEKTDLFFLSKLESSLCKYRSVCAVHGLSSDEMVTVWKVVQNKTLGICS
ncbi:UDP-GalNAc:beta-1,3-N-acetylgalactosaminyltransferase 1-like [Pleurodeles waltl]|uniref:UDP-GalNAc:beta-1, 3-N-acetylgalactosaminyltransferase 1-like n=1 Tax=Pleurodeles waltl TaxID=8319 RepID=UPI003709961F